MTNVRPIKGGACFVIPATDTAPAIRAYACGCRFSGDSGWSHCLGHTTVHGVLALRSASAVSRAEARRTAWLQAERDGAEVRECHGGTLILYPHKPKETTK